MDLLLGSLETFLDSDRATFFMIVVVGGSIAVISIIASTIRAIMISRAREQTRRELAAYVAEGTLDPDKAVAIINAGRTASEIAAANAVAHCSHGSGKCACGRA